MMVFRINFFPLNSKHFLITYKLLYLIYSAYLCICEKDLFFAMNEFRSLTYSEPFLPFIRRTKTSRGLSPYFMQVTYLNVTELYVNPKSFPLASKH